VARARKVKSASRILAGRSIRRVSRSRLSPRDRCRPQRDGETPNERRGDSHRRIRRADLRTRCLARGNSICPASIWPDTGHTRARGEIKHSAELRPPCPVRRRFDARRQHPRQRGVPYRLPRLENSSIEFNRPLPPLSLPSLSPVQSRPRETGNRKRDRIGIESRSTTTMGFSTAIFDLVSPAISLFPPRNRSRNRSDAFLVFLGVALSRRRKRIAGRDGCKSGVT